jgi:hypothetical protein
MTDSDLADEIILRLNKLIQNHPNIKADVSKLLMMKIDASHETCTHQTIQVNCENVVGTLGFLNGLVGVIKQGPKSDCGYITAVFNDNGVLENFIRTENFA